MQIRSIAFAALAAVSGQVFALTPAQVADASTVKVYMSGASASRAIIGGLFTENCSTDLDTYHSAIGTFGGVAFTAVGDAHRVYTCTMKATSPILAGKKVALFKSDIGGSGQGVFPVFFQTARSFLTTSSCGTRAATAPNYTCTGEQSQVPMAGTSDVEPGLFKGVNVPTDDPTYPQDGLDDSQLAQLDTQPVFQTVFGVAVNKALRNAMQTAQGLSSGSDLAADIPSISLAQASSYFAGALSAPADGLGWQALVSTSDTKKASRVNVCRRVPDSGTQAAANAYLLTLPCNASATAPADKGFSDAGLANAVASVGPAGNIFVFEGSSTGNVISCLGAAEDKAAYAIGHVSKENDDTTAANSKWRHVKIDGIEPSRDNLKAGKYNYFYETTLQWHKDLYTTLSTDQQDFLTAFRTQASVPASLTKLASATQKGIAALPGSYAGAYGTGTADEINFGSRVSRGGNSCAVPTFYK